MTSPRDDGACGRRRPAAFAVTDRAVRDHGHGRGHGPCRRPGGEGRKTLLLRLTVSAHTRDHPWRRSHVKNSKNTGRGAPGVVPRPIHPSTKEPENPPKDSAPPRRGPQVLLDLSPMRLPLLFPQLAARSLGRRTIPLARSLWLSLSPSRSRTQLARSISICSLSLSPRADSSVFLLLV